MFENIKAMITNPNEYMKNNSNYNAKNYEELQDLIEKEGGDSRNNHFLLYYIKKHFVKEPKKLNNIKECFNKKTFFIIKENCLKNYNNLIPDRYGYTEEEVLVGLNLRGKIDDYYIYKLFSIDTQAYEKLLNSILEDN